MAGKSWITFCAPLCSVVYWSRHVLRRHQRAAFRAISSVLHRSWRCGLLTPNPIVFRYVFRTLTIASRSWMKRRQCSPFMMDMEVNRAFNSCSDFKRWHWSCGLYVQACVKVRLELKRTEKHSEKLSVIFPPCQVKKLLCTAPSIYQTS